jgi:small multidrug resistance family-3 protein
VRLPSFVVKAKRGLAVPANRGGEEKGGWVRLSGIIASLTLFVLAGLAEIGGGYLVWQWIRGHAGLAAGIAGGLILFAYGVIATFQPAEFARTYAAYGGVFIVMSLFWGWWAGGDQPDRFDAFGAALCLVGVAVMMYWPRP